MVDMKPPLDEVYLEHFGVKGMKWGRQKTNVKSARRAPSVRRTMLKSAAAGAVIVGGVAAVAYMMPSRVGRVKMTDIGFQNPGTIRVKSERLYPKALTAGKKRVEDLLYSDARPMTNMRNVGFAFRDGQFVKI